jgi:hypothetical protein
MSHRRDPLTVSAHEVCEVIVDTRSRLYTCSEYLTRFHSATSPQYVMTRGSRDDPTDVEYGFQYPIQTICSPKSKTFFVKALPKHVEPTNRPIQRHIPWTTRLPVVAKGTNRHHHGRQWHLRKLHAPRPSARSRALGQNILSIPPPSSNPKRAAQKRRTHRPRFLAGSRCHRQGVEREGRESRLRVFL